MAAGARMAPLGLLASSILLLLQAPWTEGTSPQSRRVQGPSADFSAHSIVRPRVYHGRSKREITSTRESESEHADVLSVGLEIDGQSRILDLRLNQDLVPVGYKERHQHRGDYKTHVPSKVELCHYQGSVRELPGSWAAVSTCHGLKGVIFDGESLHHIQPEEETLGSAHYLYRHENLVANGTCGYEGTPHHIADAYIAADKARGLSRHKRAAESIRGPYNANRQSRYVELAFVVDKNEYTALGENLTRVHQHCKDIANIINALYTPLNIFIALVGVEVWTDTDEIHLLSSGDKTLSNFLQYRRERLVKSIPNDNAQLLTKMQFDEGVVGKALKGPICTYEYSGGVSVDHSSVVGLVAATVAHEMGHNFGMEHDTSECVCPEERCIMAPSSTFMGPTHWSSCSLEHLALAFDHGMDYCLRNKPERLFDSPVCGNGFVEPGEQCDCGLKDNCDNPCCDATSCMLHANASCATGECCDLRTCRPKQAGTECRSAEQECDLPEYCTGQSEYCPKDVYKIDGEACSMGKAYCYQGGCRTHNDQCKLLWGPTGSSSDALCYAKNNQGTKNGNCGYNRTGNDYLKCQDENILCGILHCKHLNERLEFGMESVAILSHFFLNSQGNIIACRTAIVDLGLNQVDPGLAPDGARCAPKKMCVNQKCMSVEDLRTNFPGGKACPSNCSGNGVCNSMGHCHCNRGFQPPDCTQPGVGGSEDSGPAEDPNARSEYIMSLYIIFLGIVPTVGLVSFGVWYARNNGGAVKQWKKASGGGGGSGPMSTLSRGFGFDGHQQLRSTQSRGLSNGGLAVKALERPMGIDSIDSSLSAHQDPACASLLPKRDPDERFNNNFFGQFKGFSISPLKGASAAAPTAPVAPAAWQVSGSSATLATTVPIKTNLKHIQRSNTLRPQASSEHQEVVKPAPPALPPPNAGSTARPLISSPVLATTTCASVEMVPAGKVPTRPAPEVPVKSSEEAQRPRSISGGHDVPSSETRRPSTEKAPEKPAASTTSTLTRIASMLYPISGMVRSASQSGGAGARDEGPGRYSTNSLPRSHHHKAAKLMDKEILRNLEISHPIPQSEIEVPSGTIPVKPEAAEKRPVLLRAQSMREPKAAGRPAIHSFGSMRQPNGPRRPTSIAASVRPSSPPPGPPVKPPTPADERKPPRVTADGTYDDCMNLVTDPSLGKIPEETSPAADNIYAVIEEAAPEKSRVPADSEYKTPCQPSVAVQVADKTDSMGLLSEIVSEISSRNLESIYSTKTLASDPEPAGTYANAPTAHYKAPSSLYSNSTTGSGHLASSAVNAPQEQPLEKKREPTVKMQKPARQEPRPASRQSSDASIKLPRTDNSPDLVSSCSANASKSPDVLGRDNKLKATLAKKAIVTPPKPASLADRGKAVKTPVAQVKTPAKDAKKPSAPVKSNVASLQQKFEQPEKPASGTLGRKKQPQATATAAAATAKK